MIVRLELDERVSRGYYVGLDIAINTLASNAPPANPSADLITKLMLVSSTVAASVESEAKNSTGAGAREQMLEERKRSHRHGSIASIQRSIVSNIPSTKQQER